MNREVQIEEKTGKRFIIEEIPCDCICHKIVDVMHIMACCDNGIIKIKTYVE